MALRESPLTAAQKRKAKQIANAREEKGMGPLKMREISDKDDITIERGKRAYGPSYKRTYKTKKG